MSLKLNNLLASIMHIQKADVENILPISPTKQITFPLFELPPELRDAIYGFSIAAGNIEILTISKRINEEASRLFFKCAVLRINLGFEDRTNSSQIQSGSVAGIQNVHLRIKPNSLQNPFDIIDIFSEYTSSSIIRNSCMITLYYDKMNPGSNCELLDMVFSDITRIKGFKSVSIRILIERYARAVRQDFMTEEIGHDTNPYKSRLLLHHRQGYLRWKRVLQCIFGPAKFDDSVEGHYLEFHPLEPVPEGWDPGLKNQFINNDAGWGRLLIE